MNIHQPAWYCVRTKPKHEHIAAANLRKNLQLEVFLPRLQIERVTQRGIVRVIEPLFHSYLFVNCVIEEMMDDVMHAHGISSLVRFGHGIPQIANSVICELQDCFSAENLLTLENHLVPGDEVLVAEGAFAGMNAKVLRNLPAKRRVQILLDFLGHPTAVEVNAISLTLARNSLVNLAPILAAPFNQSAAI